jgi:hypothetical protein
MIWLTWRQFRPEAMIAAAALAVKLTAGALTAMAVTAALCLMESWWATPISQAVADGASAFVPGITAGALLRRTLPAMALTLAIFAALQAAMPLWIRPNLAPPDHTVSSVTSLGNSLASQTGPGGDTFTLYAKTIPGQPGAWLLSSGPVNAAGQATAATPAACASVGGTSTSAGGQGNTSPGRAVAGAIAFLGCPARNGIREAITYQPANRYWRFQRTETAIYLALALVLAGYCFVRLSRRLA